jgi:hypothetical protein
VKRSGRWLKNNLVFLSIFISPAHYWNVITIVHY